MHYVMGHIHYVMGHMHYVIGYMHNVIGHMHYVIGHIHYVIGHMHYVLQKIKSSKMDKNFHFMGKKPIKDCTYGTYVTISWTKANSSK